MSIIVNGQTAWASPQIVTRGLHAVFDAADPNCYTSGSSVMYNLAVTSSRFSASFSNAAAVYPRSDAGGCLFISGSTTNYTLPTSSLPSNVVYPRYTALFWVSGSAGSGSAFAFYMGNDVYNTNYGNLTNNITQTSNAIGQVYFTAKYGNTSIIGTNGSIRLNPTGWNQVGVSISGSTASNPTFRVFVNGRVSFSSNFLNVTTNLPVLNPPQGTGNFTFGNALYYDIGLSEAEVLQNYNAQKARFGL